MDLINKNLKTFYRLDNFFIITGLIEVFLLVLITSNIYTMIIGVITIIPAYLALTKKNFKWNYFVGIWAIIKFNPITGISLMAFIIGDLLSSFGTGTLSSIVMIICISYVVLIAISSLIFGIIILIKTSKHYKLQKS
jgi:hypothetical protein